MSIVAAQAGCLQVFSPCSCWCRVLHRKAQRMHNGWPAAPFAGCAFMLQKHTEVRQAIVIHPTLQRCGSSNSWNPAPADADSHAAPAAPATTAPCHSAALCTAPCPSTPPVLCSATSSCYPASAPATGAPAPFLPGALCLTAALAASASWLPAIVSTAITLSPSSLASVPAADDANRRARPAPIHTSWHEPSPRRACAPPAPKRPARCAPEPAAGGGQGAEPSGAGVGGDAAGCRRGPADAAGQSASDRCCCSCWCLGTRCLLARGYWSGAMGSKSARVLGLEAQMGLGARL